MSAAADRTPLKFCSQGLHQINQGLTKKEKEEVEQTCRSKGLSGTSGGKAEGLSVCETAKICFGSTKTENLRH